jgi:WD40 repeat protein
MKIFVLLFLSLTPVYFFGQDSLRLTLPIGHNKTVWETKFSRNDEIVVSVAGNEIKIWDVISKKLLNSIYAEDKINQFELLNDNKTLVSLGENGIFQFWDITTSNKIKSLDTKLGFMNKFTINKDKNTAIAFDYQNSKLVIINLLNKSIKTVKSLQNNLREVCISNDNKYVFVGTATNSVKVFDFETLTEKNEIKNLKNYACDILINKNNKWLIITTQNEYALPSQILCYELNTMRLNWSRQVQDLQGQLQCSNDGQYLYGFWNGKVQKVDLLSKQTHSTDYQFSLSSFYNIGLASDEKTISLVGGRSDLPWGIENFGFLYFVNTKDMKVFDSTSGHNSFIRNICYTNNGDFYATTAFSEGDGERWGDDYFMIWDSKEKSRKFKLSSKAIEITNLTHHPSFRNNMLFLKKGDNKLQFWNLQTGKLETVLNNKSKINDNLSSFDVSKDGKYLAMIYHSDVGNNNEQFEITTELWDLEKIEQNWIRKRKYKSSYQMNLDIAFTYNNDILCSADSVFLLNLQSKKILQSYDGLYAGAAKTSNEDDLIFVANEADIVYFDLKNKTRNNLYKHNCDWEPMIGNYFSALYAIPNSNILISAKIDTKDLDSKECNKHILLQGYSIQIWDTKNFNLLKQFPVGSDRISSISVSKDHKTILLSSYDKSVILLDFETGKIKANLKGHNTEVISAKYIKDDRFIISYSRDLSIKLWDVNSLKEIYTRYDLENNNWLIKIPQSPFYMCSKGASKLLHYVTPSFKVIGFDQLDPIYNRPDNVIEKIGKYFDVEVDKNLVQLYKDAWIKRMKQLGIDTTMYKNKIEVPYATITNSDKIEYNNSSGKINLKFSASDTKHNLLRYNIYINEVPVYGSKGISISKGVNQFEKYAELNLSEGENKIQVSVINDIGLESFRYPCFVRYTPPNPLVSNTYYIGIGVDSFMNSYYNLDYCVKDIYDFGSILSKEKNPKKIILINKDVTKESVLKLKDVLKHTTEQDKVIISCSSHGLLDKNNNFYLAMHDMDFNKPESKGLSYEDLQGLLDSIPARKKLLLLDACNSGENEKVNNHEIVNKNYVKNDGTKGVAEEEDSSDPENIVKSSFETMMELFVNVENQTGTTVISAAGGKQDALEGAAVLVDGKPISNGAFTYSIIEYLTKNAKNKNKLTVNQLKQYAEQRVAEITNGKQKPTSRQETMEVDWDF